MNWPFATPSQIDKLHVVIRARPTIISNSTLYETAWEGSITIRAVFITIQSSRPNDKEADNTDAM